MRQATRTIRRPEQRKAIAVHHTDTDSGAWDGAENEANLSNDDGEAIYKQAYAWQDPDKDADTKAAYKFIHHDVTSAGKVTDANVKGCQAGIDVLNGGRGGADIPDADRQGVYDHLAAHLKDADVTPAELNSRKPGGEVRQGYQPVPYHQDPDETVMCPGCGRGNDTDASFCDQCDHPLKPTTAYSRDDDENVQCPECKKFNDDDAHYCDQCGIRLQGRPDVVVEVSTEPEETPDSDAMDEVTVGLADTESGFENGVSEAFASKVPKGNLVRDFVRNNELRQGANGEVTQLVGMFAAYNVWYEISSWWEGEFMERIAPGAFTDTIANDIDGMRCLYDHGFDPTMGNKPIGPITSLIDTPLGPEYVVDFLDTDYNRDFLIPALRGSLISGDQVGSQLGASMRFEVIEDTWLYPQQPTMENPRQLPQRTVLQARVFEFGPVTFPASPGATAGARSASDDWLAKLRDDDVFFAGFSQRVGVRTAQAIRQRVPQGLKPRQRAVDTRQQRTLQLKARAALLTAGVRALREG